MPLTQFQKGVLALLKQHRNPDSYIAGGIAIHRAPNTSRHSNDIDFFHDTAEAVTASANADITLLEKKGYRIEKLIDQPSFIRSVISKGNHSLKLEWVRDTAFRFFPVVEDEVLGYRLHDVDLAVNKCLALANRDEVRDIIDLLQLNQDVISLTGACWGACGKDPGFTPELILDCMRRHSIIDATKLAAESLTKEISPTELKLEWLQLLDSTQEQLIELPIADLGCLFLDGSGKVIHKPNAKNITGCPRHFGSVGGSWPRMVT